MFEKFQHYLSYGSTDQKTVRELSPYFDGLVVPGTIAAFQAEGTKGFVLSLSARTADPYVIDSRFPLFQNRLTKPKKSHQMLADVLGVPALVSSDQAPTPTDFSDDVVTTIATSWIDFNVGFDVVTTKTFDKYASRLQEVVLPENRQQPTYVLPPYTMVRSLSDGWAAVSQRLWDASNAYANRKGIASKLRRVVAANTAELWGQLATSLPDRELVAWVSDLDEFRNTSELELIAYGRALQRTSEQGKSVFALYGGFLSVLFARYGLSGSSHGIGFGEHRDWIELPTSGAPPARYYVPRLHRYIGVDLAEAIWNQFPELIACSCEECEGNSPIALDYHALMRHSVRARSAEIKIWQAMSTQEVVLQLRADFSAFDAAVELLDQPVKVTRRAAEIYGHLLMWARVMTELTSNDVSA